MRCPTPGRLALLGVLLGAALSLAAAPRKQPMTAERLAQRVLEHWNAWKAMNLHAVFLLYAPSYRRAASEAAFMEYARGMLGIIPIDYKIAQVELTENGTKATVRLDARTEIAPFGAVLTRQVQRWVYEEGDWYRLVDPPSVPIPPAGPTDPADLPPPVPPPI